ncbi:hypothetical protein QR680_002063 [Steinernema hermaphroditum]|uniref:CRAL-TRIO domain-containing protein n=1 Tax=Steinernema hermaphroditum TaxID=289476 RepID=A0AA39LHE8_9BILA|nr:hypothetical protein QR680_002063 [Steinernema hermaphroditum]
MVQTYQSPVRVYKHPFEIVMAAYQKRFPTCPQIPIFVGSEITYEYHSPDGAEEVIERKCQLNVEAPYLVKKIAGVDYVYFTQKNSLDRRKRTLLIEASNISFANRIVVIENCNYYVHPENSDWTCFEQSASLDVKSFFGFESSVEKLAVKQYAANLAKGKEILEFFIDDLLKSGTTYIPPFKGAGNSGDVNSLADSAIDMAKPSCEETSDGSENTAVQTMANCLISGTSAATPEPGQLRRTSGVSEGNSAGFVRASSMDDPEAKLESEYIRRFLGQLSALEESRLCELKYGLQSAHKGKLPNDAHLLRFLRAREFDVARAREMVLNSLRWRKLHNVDKILQEFEPPAVLMQFFPGCWYHHDKQGRPVFVLRLGQLDIKGLLRTVGLETVVKFTLSICEQGLIKASEATKKLGQPISTWTLLVDLEGLSMRHLWRPGVQALLRIIEIVEANYPETMGLVLIARAPRVFPVLWTLISPFIDENTRCKFMINSGGNDTVLPELAKYIDPQLLPEFLGGPCFCMAPEGGHVPKSMYRPVALDGHFDDDDVLSSTYTSAHLHRGAPCEVLVPVSTPGCVVTWDFDILKGDCEFLVYHTDKILQTPVQPHSPTTAVERVTAAIGATSLSSSPKVVYSDPDLVLGVDLTIEEKPVTFGEGDSMQGSHYCSKKGTYIMQWRHPEVSSGQHQSFDFSLSGHKCKLIYYHELLDSANFRGSVASLESCRSSFSSLAAGTPTGTPMSRSSRERFNVRFLA